MDKLAKRYCNNKQSVSSPHRHCNNKQSVSSQRGYCRAPAVPSSCIGQLCIVFRYNQLVVATTTNSRRSRSSHGANLGRPQHGRSRPPTRCPRGFQSQSTRPSWSYSSDFHQSPPGRSATSLAINSRRPFVLRPRGPSGAQRVLQEPGVLWQYPSGLDRAAAAAPAVLSPPCA